LKTGKFLQYKKVAQIFKKWKISRVPKNQTFFKLAKKHTNFPILVENFFQLKNNHLPNHPKTTSTPKHPPNNLQTQSASAYPKTLKFNQSARARLKSLNDAKFEQKKIIAIMQTIVNNFGAH
jgi:hypothetical protein